MRAARVLFPAFLILASLTAAIAPTTAQQGQPVAKCSRDCDPIAINGGAPKEGADPVTVVLYGHFEDILNMAPMNTQAPNRTHEPDLNRGFLMPSIDVSGVPCPTSCADVHLKNSDFRMFLSPGLVEYLQEGWRTWQQPGLGADLHLSGDPIVLYWYMSVHALPQQNSGSGPGAAAQVGVAPQVAVYAHMETGRFLGRGETIAESQPRDVPPGPERTNMVTLPSQPDVYEFRIPMQILKGDAVAAAKDTGIIVGVEPYQITAEHADFMQADWRFRSGADFPDRVLLPIVKPMETKQLRMYSLDPFLGVQWSVQNVFGGYDFDPASLRVKLDGPTPMDANQLQPRPDAFRHWDDTMDGMYRPLNLTFLADLRDHPLKDGSYHLTLSVTNLEGTYRLVQTGDFVVDQGHPNLPGTSKPPAKSPDAGLAATGVLVAVAALAVRRRA